jgi:hypothetical protein
MGEGIPVVRRRGGPGEYIPAGRAAGMATPPPATLKCTTCGTEFSSTDVAELQNHADHPLVKIEQA